MPCSIAATVDGRHLCDGRIVTSQPGWRRSALLLVALAAAYAIVALWRVTAVFEMPAWQAVIPVMIVSGLALLGALSLWWRGRDRRGHNRPDDP